MNSSIFWKSFFILILIVSTRWGLHAQQSQNGGYKPDVYLDKMSDIQIDRLVFYQNPLFIEHKKLTDDYVPEWYPAYCANGRFDYFKDYVHEAVMYFQRMSNVTSEQLARHLDEVKAKGLLSPESNPNPYEYIYGEVWFTYKKSNEKIGLVMGYVPPGKIDNFSFGDIYTEKKTDCFDPFKNMFNFHQPLIYEDNILKRANLNYVFYDILKTDSVNFKGTTFETFTVLLKNAPTYIRSRLENGHRIFETVKNTSSGPVVVGENAGKAGFWRYWWVIAGGLAVVVLLWFVVSKRRNKRK